MGADAQNGQYGSVSLFGQDSAPYASTGSSGQPTADPNIDSAVLASGVVVSVPGQSAQVAPDLATVHFGDTAAASYGPVPRDGDPLTGLPESFLTATGAGQGSVHTSHPGARP
jgi:hypothetical protein